MPQWDPKLRFDRREALPGVKVPVRVLAFAEDIQGPLQDGDEVAQLIPRAQLLLLEGLRRGSWYCAAHERINGVIGGLSGARNDAAALMVPLPL